MKKIYHLLKREIYTFKNIYTHLLAVKTGILLFLLAVFLFIDNKSVAESANLILHFFLFMALIVTIPLSITFSLISDKKRMKDIKSLPVSSSLYIIIKFFVFLVITLIEFGLYLLLQVEDTELLIYLLFFYMPIFISFILVIYLLLLNSFEYKIQLFLTTITLYGCTSFLMFIGVINIGYDISVIWLFVLSLMISVFIIYIWGLVFDKNSEI